MGWAALITALLQVFGPLLKELLEKWLNRKLTAAAADLEFTSFAAEGEARDALFDAALDRTRGPLRRLLLKRLRTHAAEMGVTSTNAPAVPESVAAELAVYADEADED